LAVVPPGSLRVALGPVEVTWVVIKTGCHYSGFWLLDFAVCKTAPPTGGYFSRAAIFWVEG